MTNLCVACVQCGELHTNRYACSRCWNIATDQDSAAGNDACLNLLMAGRVFLMTPASLAKVGVRDLVWKQPEQPTEALLTPNTKIADQYAYINARLKERGK